MGIQREGGETGLVKSRKELLGAGRVRFVAARVHMVRKTDEVTVLL
uniref:Uncharacterized protein n=1 Tax=Peronospora matthiolae TaxID=2874970 RepID=A0AAV1VKP1_9STRA